MNQLVEISGLTLDAETRQGPAHLLRGIDLTIGRGRILGIVGESGSGKSTLAACLLRLLPANLAGIGGRIMFDGTDLLQLDEAGMDDLRGRRIAMIFQDPMTALNPLFTIGTHLLDTLRRRHRGLSRAEGLARAAEMLGRVGLADPRQRLAAYPHQLSGGMRQRVVIAMALLAEPDLLVADEPTTALDATVEAQIVDLFDRLRQDFAGSVVFISHHLGLVAGLCDELCVMYGGTIVETGPVAQVLTHPRHPYTRALLDCEIADDPHTAGGHARLASIAGDVPEPTAAMTHCIFRPRCRHASAACDGPPPELTDIDPGHRAACFRATEALW